MTITLADVQADPERYRLLDSGAIYDNEAGHIAGHTGDGPYQITKDNARELATKRWDMQREEFVNGFLNGTPGIDRTKGETEMWRAIGEKTAILLHDAKSARGFAELLNTVLKITKPDETHALTSVSATPQALDLAARLVDMLDRATASQPQPTKGRVIDADSV